MQLRVFTACGCICSKPQLCRTCCTKWLPCWSLWTCTSKSEMLRTLGWRESLVLALGSKSANWIKFGSGWEGSMCWGSMIMSSLGLRKHCGEHVQKISKVGVGAKDDDRSAPNRWFDTTSDWASSPSCDWVSIQMPWVKPSGFRNSVWNRSSFHSLCYFITKETIDNRQWLFPHFEDVLLVFNRTNGATNQID